MNNQLVARSLAAGLAALMVPWLFAARAAGAADAAAVRSDLAALAFDATQPRAAAGLRVTLGPARLQLESGVLFPSTPVGGKLVEWTFSGTGRIELEAPDRIEAGQLELFTGSASLDETFDRAVIVVAGDAAPATLAARPAAETSSPDVAATARAFHARWLGSAERRRLNVDLGLLADGVGDPHARSFTVIWMESAARGTFLFAVDPDAGEQVTVGAFRPLDVDERSRRKIERLLGREQRAGRQLGSRFEDLGVFDNWLSASLPGATGELQPGWTAFEPEHYAIDLRVDDREETLSGSARLRLLAVGKGNRVVQLRHHQDLEVVSASDAEGRPLPLFRGAEATAVVLAAAPAPGSATELTVEFAGKLLGREGASRALRDTIFWYPHAGQRDRATYEVRIEWPEALKLAASGVVVDSGVARGRRWELRRLDRPSWVFGFEVGRFRESEIAAGPVRVRFLVDPDGKQLGSEVHEQIREAVVSSLAFYGELFGAYPDRELTVVTSPREFSQALPGMVTLSNWMMADFGWLGALLGFEDRRTIVAHELAHQWWGHRVGWASYRDQWISEAMANWAALTWARQRLPEKERPQIGPTSFWRGVLTADTAEGRPIESLGPVVLGTRLASSKSEDAYSAIVYKKGAIVLDLIAESVGYQPFVAALERICEVAKGRALSTENLIDAISRLTGRDLTPLAEQYVYGTGIPEVFYRYAIEEAPDGKWAVAGSARQRNPMRFRFRVERGAGGRPAVKRDRVETATKEGIVVARIAIRLEDPPGAGRGADPQWKLGRLVVAGERADFRLELDEEPAELRVDPRGESFALFFDEEKSRKRTQQLLAVEAAARGDAAEAGRLFRESLASSFTAEEIEDAGARRRAQRRVDAISRLGLCRLALDDDRLDDAARELEAADDAAGREGRLELAAERRRLAGRLLLARGDAHAAFRRLKSAEAGDVEAQIYLAIAALETGRKEAAQRAAAAAAKAGGDVAALEELLKG